MNCFQIIKSVLDEAYNQIPGDDSEKDGVIIEALNYLSEGYIQLLGKSQSIDYKDTITRFAYIYKYVSSHANLVCGIITQSNDLAKVFDAQQKINIACIGGGPGSDFLGILKYLMSKGKTPSVKFQLCDKEKNWAESWSDVDDKVDPKFRISTSYLPLDVTKPDEWKPHTKYFTSDIFTMIYFMSEIFTLRDSADEYFTNLFSQAKPGALFLFVDNNHTSFYGWFDELAKAHNIKIKDSNQYTMFLPSDEDKSDLGIYFQKFQSYSYPKIKANIAYRVGQKQQ
ncbi:hypothetical protein LC653_34065 [Nostoc sp. CHAB 5784]|uniref:hypothetical protein n=1 Tax=Nostoc mirabile TaxID=2907820 RepID=UPI001E403E2A|nr:hypothetical protein [Nostoc mirabile]MCC5668744.1 hypothetical protein [Nostoc mirabile CHAB5784]